MPERSKIKIIPSQARVPVPRDEYVKHFRKIWKKQSFNTIEEGISFFAEKLCKSPEYVKQLYKEAFYGTINQTNT